MSYKQFTSDELNVVEVENSMNGRKVEYFNTPITSKENFELLYSGKTPMWIPFFNEFTQIKIDCDPETRARSKTGGIDGWGVPWVWEEAAGGAMVVPGNPVCKDIEHWEDYLTVPKPSEWDWEECYERQIKKRRPDRMFYVSNSSCMFERLIAVMDFADAAVALIDDDQKEHVHRFFRAVTDSRKEYYTLTKKWFNPDVLNFNDDWGSQRAEFFSVDTVEEMLFPYVKEIGDHVKKLGGMYWDLHCCGVVEKFVPYFIEEGFNSWGGQPLNDKAKLKRMYGDKMVFSHNFTLPAGASEEDLKAATQKYMDDIGYDNRVIFNSRLTPEIQRAVYEASRRNYDRMVADGTAIL